MLRDMKRREMDGSPQVVGDGNFGIGSLWASCTRRPRRSGVGTLGSSTLRTREVRRRSAVRGAIGEGCRLSLFTYVMAEPLSVLPTIDFWFVRVAYLPSLLFGWRR
jgi:hypothetical protein